MRWDGTVFDALQGIAGSNLPLGIVPFGTGNILAHNLNMPLRTVAAARWLLAARPRAIPLGKITCHIAGESHSWFFAIAAGMGLHAAMLEVSRRYEKEKTGRLAYFASGIKTLGSQPLLLFEQEITTVEGKLVRAHVCETIAVRVPKLNLWRTGAALDRPFLRVATVPGASRWRLTRATLESLILGAGKRKQDLNGHAATRYEDAVRVECRPIPDLSYQTPMSVEADGEILEAASITIEIAKESVCLLTNP